MDWLSLIMSYSWSSQVETTLELTSLAGKLDLATTYLGEEEVSPEDATRGLAR